MTCDLNDLDPGIRRTVAWLQEHGFRTVDSGDGRSKYGTPYEVCALPYPNVTIGPEADRLVSEARRLVAALRERGIPVHPIGSWYVGNDPHAHTVVRIKRRKRYVSGAEIQADYDPVSEDATIRLFMVDDALLFGEPGGWHEDAAAVARAVAG